MRTNYELGRETKSAGNFIRIDYLPKARATVGLGQMPGGAAYYRYLVAQTTTTDMTPEAIHALGLAEVDRIHGEMEKVKTQVGFKGTLPQFFEYMRTDPKFAPKSAPGPGVQRSDGARQIVGTA